MKKKLLALVCGIMVTAMSFTSYAGEWEQQGEDWYYRNDDGTYAKNTVVDGYYVSYTGRMINETHQGYKRGVNIACQMVMNDTAVMKKEENYTYFDIPYVTDDTISSVSGMYHELIGFGTDNLVNHNRKGRAYVNDVDRVKNILSGYVDLFNNKCLYALELPIVERYKAIADVVVNHMTYGADVRADVAIYQGIGRCPNYAGMYKVFCNMAGLDCDAVACIGVHDWNKIKVDGVEYWVDTQFMDTDGEGFMVPVGSGSRWDGFAASSGYVE